MFFNIGTAYNDGTGDKIRDSFDKLNKYVGEAVNVTGFGAVGDGITNDTIAIQNAIQFCVDNNKNILFFPTGHYYVTDKFTIPDNFTIIGEGRESTDNVYLGIDSFTTVNVDGTDYFDVVISGIIDPETKIVIDELNTFRLQSGDALKHLETGSLGEIKSIPNNTTIRFRSSYFPTLTINDTIRCRPVISGSIIRYISLDGNYESGKKIIDQEGILNLTIKDIGFVGSGLDKGEGSGIHIKRRSVTNDTHKALADINFENVSFRHFSEYSIRIRQTITSTFKNIRITKCGGTALEYTPENNVGGTTTSTHIDTIYIQSSKIGIHFETAAYCTLTNPVIEGCDVGYIFNGCYGMTLNSPASETIKYDYNRNGTTFIFNNCTGTTLNSPTIYYNTELYKWTRAGILIYGNKPDQTFGTLSGGHFHNSVSYPVKVVASKIYDTERETKLYFDASYDTYGFTPATENTGSNLDGAYWKVGRRCFVQGFDRDIRINGQYWINEFEKISYSSSSPTYSDTRDPLTTDAGSFGETWKNTNYTQASKFGRFVCIGQNTALEYQWINAENLYYMKFYHRKLISGESNTKFYEGNSFINKIGRNVGCDVSFSPISRVFCTNTDSSKKLTAYVDGLDGIVDGYYHKLKFYKNDNERFSDTWKITDVNIVDINGTNYIRTKSYINSVTYTPGFTTEPTLTPAGQEESCYITFDTFGINYKHKYSHYNFEDRGDGSFYAWFYFPISEFFSSGEKLTLSNLGIDWMNNTFTIDTVNLTNSPIDNEMCFEIKFSETLQESNYRNEREIGFFHRENQNNILNSTSTINNPNAYNIYDPYNNTILNDGRSQQIIIPDGSNNLIVNVKNADKYHYFVNSPYKNENAWVENITKDSITITRQNSTGDLFLIIESKRKKWANYDFRFTN